MFPSRFVAGNELYNVHVLIGELAINSVLHPTRFASLRFDCLSQYMVMRIDNVCQWRKKTAFCLFFALNVNDTRIGVKFVMIKEHMTKNVQN